ncbi:MAG: hypothetical protein HYV77_04570 [Candidatus Wildermuthbacteria bacterium]|nr:hypothetical protein [Candidatus Wildermuthbacteria bacterium]
MNPFLTDKSLSQFLRKANISQKTKDFFLAELPAMDEENRASLARFLAEITFLDDEEKEAVLRVKNFQKSGSFFGAV